MFDHDRHEYYDIDVARCCTLRIQDGGHQTGTLNNFWMASDSNVYPHIIDHARLQYIIANIMRRCLTTEIEDGGHQREVEITFTRW